jgi:4-amino-4-deoxy-L-arabinose transferase-like glycosyltransferase
MTYLTCVEKTAMTVRSKKPFKQKNKWLEIICVIALAIAYLSYLGYLPLDVESDEARRAVVTTEMMISHNYITPTINGELYFNKPPLYNWIVAEYFKIFGDYSMFAFRLQTIIAVFITGLLVYFFTKKYTNHLVAFFSALAYMSNGRLLIYESLFGLIDTTFTLAVYANMMLIFYFGEKKKYYALFIASYITCAIAFLLKGVPALAFQALSLCVYFGLKKDFKKLLSNAHFLGIAILVLILGSYYALYFYQNHFETSLLFSNLLHESTQRTFIEYAFVDTLGHMTSFPFEMLYHFLPWTIFLFACLQKKFWITLNQNKFIQYSFWLFIVNIPVYWVSVDVYPKYLFMFVPLLYSISFYFYFQLGKKAWQKKMIDIILVAAGVLIFIASCVVPFTNVVDDAAYPYLKSSFLIIAFATCLYFSTKTRYRLYAFLAALILGRIWFNWFVLVQRGDSAVTAKTEAAQIINITRGKPLYIFQNAETYNFDGFSYYIETARNEILRKSKELSSGAYYIVDTNQLRQQNFAIDYSFKNFPFQNQLYLVHAKK